MNLRELAASDAALFVEDNAAGFGFPLTLTNPDGGSLAMAGLANDVFTKIDPETGMMVAGRSASVTLSMKTLETACFGQPRGVSDSSSRPWIVEIDDVLGNCHRFKISLTQPDLTIGVIVCHLEILLS